MMKSLLLASSVITLCCVGQPALATDSVRAPVTFPTSLPHAYYSVQAQLATAANSLTGTLPGSQVTGTVPAAAQAAAVTGQVNGNQIYGDINTPGNISAAGQVSGGYLWSAAGISTPGSIFATGNIWSTSGVGTNGNISGGGNITSTYGNIATTWGEFVGNLTGTATAALAATTAGTITGTVDGSHITGTVSNAAVAGQAVQLTASSTCGTGTALTVYAGVLGCTNSVTNAVNATTANQAYGLTTGATVAGSQVLGPVGSATYATSSGSSTTTQYALVSGHSSNYQTLNIAVAASGVNPSNLVSNTAQCQAAGFSGSPIACAGSVSNGVAFFSQSIGGNTYYYSETVSASSTGGNSDSGGGTGGGSGGGPGA